MQRLGHEASMGWQVGVRRGTYNGVTRRRALGIAFRAAWLATASAAMVWASPPPGTMIDLNQATRAEIEAVRGVGVELAERVLSARAHGPFRDWQDARRRVKGLGKRAMAGLAEAQFHIAGEKASAPGYSLEAPASESRRP
ncbi:MAG: ComEA family DNA-binding protein [Burkholderiaceae bacterium]